MQKLALIPSAGSRLALASVIILALIAGGCASSAGADDPAVLQAINNHLAPLNPQEVVLDFVHTHPNFPDKAYASATVTHNFATREGTPQKEYLGFLLTREGEGWKVAEKARYTKEAKNAELYLAGRKR